jgi:glutamyl-tRNA reductase
MSEFSAGEVVALVSHARSVPARQREEVAHRIRAELAGQALVLETCHRIEAYWIAAPGTDATLGPSWLPEGGQILVGSRAIEHAIAVAVGRDSVVVGEDQVLHQLRQAVDVARSANDIDPTLERLFAMALNAGRRARSWRQGPQRSLADLAIAEIERRSGRLVGRDLLIVGAGRMGWLVAVAARTAGARIALTSRTQARAQTLAGQVSAEVAHFDPGDDVARFAGVVIALNGRWQIGPTTVEALARSGAVLVDLSVPPAVSDELVLAVGPRLISADALAIADEGQTGATAAELRRLDRLIEQTTGDYLEWLAAHEGRTTADALIQGADRDREAELALLWRHLPELEPEARAAIDEMTRHLARRLLRGPLELLGRDTDGETADVVREIFAL